MTTPIQNPHSKWYHCLCCMQPKPAEPTISASPGGKWDNGHFEAPAPTEAFKKEFEGK